jgi:hypothetical protein
LLGQCLGATLYGLFFQLAPLGQLFFPLCLRPGLLLRLLACQLRSALRRGFSLLAFASGVLDLQTGSPRVLCLFFLRAPRCLFGNQVFLLFLVLL